MTENGGTEALERHEFGAEVGRLLDLVVHSLYSEREIFLRELVANAADAIDRRRFEALSQPALALPENPNVRIVADKDARTISLSDCGIGMSREDLIRNLGTIARSGTRAFGKTLEETPADQRPSLIGQFGVGFYSAFMVADRVEVTSRAAGEATANRWVSEGRGDYSIGAAEREQIGTDIVLHIKSDADEFLDGFRLHSIIRKWADHITIPVVLVQDDEENTVNEGTALWRKPKAEVTDEQYNEFYQSLGYFYDKPWATMHWRAEGAMEFSALLFIPGSKPMEALEGERESQVRLHVRRMFITDDAKLLPNWLRFVQGVVDTEDLPLNVSREMLQSTPVLARIRKAVTNRVLTELKNRSKDVESYEEFWANFGPILKEGLWDDAEHRTELAALLRFRSSTQEGLTSLADYIGSMKEDQKSIYFLTGDHAAALTASPQLEGFKAKGIEVLLLSDHVDAFWPDRLGEFDGKTLKSVSQGVDDLFGEDESKPEDASLLAGVKDALKGLVAEVRFTNRLVDSACVLASGKNSPDLHMQRLMRRAGREGAGGMPVLELNRNHAWIKALEGKPDQIADQARLMLDLARVQDGDAPLDPTGFSRRISEALSRAVA